MKKLVENMGRIQSIIRWNAMAKVVRANRRAGGIGGALSIDASCATLIGVQP